MLKIDFTLQLLVLFSPLWSTLYQFSTQDELSVYHIKCFFLCTKSGGTLLISGRCVNESYLHAETNIRNFLQQSMINLGP